MLKYWQEYMSEFEPKNQEFEALKASLLDLLAGETSYAAVDERTFDDIKEELLSGKDTTDAFEQDKVDRRERIGILISQLLEVNPEQATELIKRIISDNSIASGYRNYIKLNFLK